MSAQGHGDRHCEEVGLSSVSSPKQIQHFRGSLLDGTDWGFGLIDVCLCWFCGVGEDSDDDGWFRNTVWESSDVVD